MNEEISSRVLLEEMNGHLMAIREYVTDIPKIRQDVGGLKEDMEWLKPRVLNIQDGVKEHSADIKQIKKHIGLPIIK